MRFLKKFLFGLFITLVVSLQGKCQPLVSPPGVASQNQVFIGFGLEPELVAKIGYIRLVSDKKQNVDFYGGASLKLAPLILSNKAFRVSLIGAMDWEMSSKWKSRFTSDVYLAHDENTAGAMNGLGVELHSTTLHFGKKWSKGFELGWQYTVLTHIRHSAEAKDTFNERYPNSENRINGPKDGWYKSTASRFRLGFTGSKSLSDRWDWQFGIGALFAIQSQGILLGFSHAQVPVYLKSTIFYRY